MFQLNFTRKWNPMASVMEAYARIKTTIIITPTPLHSRKPHSAIACSLVLVVSRLYNTAHQIYSSL